MQTVTAIFCFLAAFLQAIPATEQVQKVNETAGRGDGNDNGIHMRSDQINVT